METHAVPQEIMGMEFKLFGNFLSLREFIFIAVGLAIAYFFYFLMQQGILPAILAFPAILFFGLGGTLIGLVPIQEKSLDKWIVNYFSAINRPTQRVWKKPGFTGDDPVHATGVVTKSHVVSTPASQQTDIFKAGTTNAPRIADAATIEAEKDASQDLQRITSVITQIESGTQTTAQQTAVASAQTAPTVATTTSPPTATTTPQQKVSQPTQTPVQLQQHAAPTSQPTAPSIPPHAPVTTISTNQSPLTMAHKAVPRPPAAQQKRQQPTPKLQKQPSPTQSTSEKPQNSSTPEKPSEKAPHILSIEDKNVKDYATTITGLTSKPNTVNIVVKDAKGLILPSVVCVIKNPQGEPVRAAISNVLGQILNNVPLKNGTYRISLTKQGFIFPEITRTIKGKTYPPIEIKAL